ncbi:MAG: hypothetical protein BWY32_01287 [bacterium ADurb.Bin243]|nr:MAG: hypothetical protein BWY32_01287 [bacterium ADurb.Bin243]
MLIIGLILTLNVIIIFFYMRMKKMVETLSGSNSLYSDLSELAKKCSQLNSEFEKVAMIRIAELEDKISHLKELVMLADERILQIVEFQKNLDNLQVQRQGTNGVSQQAIDSDLITRFRLNMKPDLSNLEIRMIQKMKEEYGRMYAELSGKIEELKIRQEPVPKPQKDIQGQTGVSSISPAAALNSISPPPVNAGVNPATTHHGKIKQTGYIMPKEHLEPAAINGKYSEIYKLAEQGLDATAISEITKVEKRTINFILNLRKIQ